MEKIKVAVIGCGTIANDAHIPSYICLLYTSINCISAELLLIGTVCNLLEKHLALVDSIGNILWRLAALYACLRLVKPIRLQHGE